MVTSRVVAHVLIFSLVVGSTVQAQDAAIPATPPIPTIWSFLGVPQGVKKVQGALTNRRGNFPKTEPKPALKALNDPENLKSPVKAIKQAAEIKKAEDLKPQKIKAIKYLTSIGCGCYDKDGKVTEALIASAEDCTEEVRLTTMKSVEEAAGGKCCSQCGIVCCCNEKMMKKLAEISYEKDDTGCWLEPSARVREAAEKALKKCCPGGMPLEVLKEEPIEDDQGPIGSEKGSGGGIRGEGSSPPRPAPMPDDTTAIFEDTQVSEPIVVNEPARMTDKINLRISDARQAALDQSKVKEPSLFRIDVREQSQFRSASVIIPSSRQPSMSDMRALAAQQAIGIKASPNPTGGVIMAYSADHRLAYVHFEDRNARVAVGTQVYLRPDPATGKSGFLGFWRVTASESGCAMIMPLGDETTQGELRAGVGDHVSVGAPKVAVAPASYRR